MGTKPVFNIKLGTKDQLIRLKNWLQNEFVLFYLLNCVHIDKKKRVFCERTPNNLSFFIDVSEYRDSELKQYMSTQSLTLVNYQNVNRGLSCIFPIFSHYINKCSKMHLFSFK